MIQPTAKQAKLFELYIREQYDVSLRDIRTLPFIDRLWCRLRQLNLANFVAITLDGNKIYLRVDVYNRMTPKGKIELLYHELAHINQYRTTPRFRSKYLFRRSKRLRFEIDAYKNSIEVDMFFDGHSNANYYAVRLRSYLAREPEVIAARKEFHDYMNSGNHKLFAAHWERAMSDEA